MTRQDTVTRVIEKFGENITLVSTTGDTYSEDTGWTSGTGASVVTKAIPYDYFSGNLDFKSFGNLDKGDIRLIIPGTVTIAEKDTFTYDSKSYIVTRVNPLPFEGVELGIVVEASEQL